MDGFSSLEKSLPDLSYLTEDERKKILSVLSRDELLQKKQAEQISLLRHEIGFSTELDHQMAMHPLSQIQVNKL